MIVFTVLGFQVFGFMPNSSDVHPQPTDRGKDGRGSLEFQARV